jgi:hypothetical protein
MVVDRRETIVGLTAAAAEAFSSREPADQSSIAAARHGHRGNAGHHKHKAEHEVGRHGFAEQHH